MGESHFNEGRTKKTYQLDGVCYVLHSGGIFFGLPVRSREYGILICSSHEPCGEGDWSLPFRDSNAGLKA